MTSISGQVTGGIVNFIEGASNLLAGGIPVGTIAKTTAKAVATMAVGAAVSGIVNNYAKSRNLEAYRRQLGILSGARLTKVEELANKLDRIILSGIEDPNLDVNPLKNELDTYLSFTNPVGAENGSQDGKVLASLGGIKNYTEGGWGHEAAIDDFLNRQVELSEESFSKISKVSLLLLANKIQSLMVMIRKYAELPGSENAARLDKLSIALNNLVTSYPTATGARIDNVGLLQTLVEKFVVEKKKQQNALSVINECQAAKDSIAEICVNYAEFGLRLLDNNCAERQSKTDIISLMRGIASNNLASNQITPINSPVGQIIANLMKEVHLAHHDLHDERTLQSGMTENFDIVKRLQAISTIMENSITQEIIDNLRSSLPAYLSSVPDRELQLFALGFIQVLSKLAIAEALLDDAEKLAKDYGQNVPSTSDGYALRIELALESKKSAERIMDGMNKQNGLCKLFLEKHVKQLDGNKQDLAIPLLDSVAIGVPGKIRQFYGDVQPDGIIHSIHINSLNSMLQGRNESDEIFNSLELSSKRKKSLDKKDSILDTPDVLFTMAMTMAISRKSSTRQDNHDLQNVQVDDNNEYEAKLVFMVTVDRISRLFGYLPNINRACKKNSLVNDTPQLCIDSIKSGAMLTKLIALREHFETLAAKEKNTAGTENRIILEHIKKAINDVESLSELLGVGVGLKASNERKIQQIDEVAVSQIQLLRDEITQVEKQLQSYDQSSVMITEAAIDDIQPEITIVPVAEYNKKNPTLTNDRTDLGIQDKVKLRVWEIKNNENAEVGQDYSDDTHKIALGGEHEVESVLDDNLPSNDEKIKGDINSILSRISGPAGQFVTSLVKLKDDIQKKLSMTALKYEDMAVRGVEDVGDSANSGVDFVVNGMVKLSPAILFAASLQANFDVTTSAGFGLGALAANGAFGLVENRAEDKMRKSFNALSLPDATKIDEISDLMDRQIINALHPDLTQSGRSLDELDPKLRELMAKLKEHSGPEVDSTINKSFRKIKRLRSLRLDETKSTNTESRIKGLFDNYYEIKGKSMDKAYAYVVLYENKMEMIIQLMKLYAEQPGQNSEEMLRKLSSSLRLLNNKFLEVSMADELGWFKSQTKRKHLAQALVDPINLVTNELILKQKSISLQRQIHRYGDKLVQQTCSMSQFIMSAFDNTLNHQLNGRDDNLPIKTPTLDALSSAKFNLGSKSNSSSNPTCQVIAGLLLLLNQANDAEIDFDEAKNKLSEFPTGAASELVVKCFKKLIQITLEMRRLEQETIVNGAKGFEDPALFEAKIVQLMQQYKDAKTEFNNLFSKDQVCMTLKKQHVEGDSVRVDMSTKLSPDFTMGTSVKSVKDTAQIRILQQCTQIDRELSQTDTEIRAKIQDASEVPVISKRVYQSADGRLRMVRDRDTIEGLSYVLMTKRIQAQSKRESVGKAVRADYRQQLDAAKIELIKLIESQCNNQVIRDWLLMTLDLKYQNTLRHEQYEKNLLAADHVLQDCFRLLLLAARAHNGGPLDLTGSLDLCRFMQMQNHAAKDELKQWEYINQAKPVTKIFSDKHEYSDRINSYEKSTNEKFILLFQCYEQGEKLKYLSTFLPHPKHEAYLDKISQLAKTMNEGASHKALCQNFDYQQEVINEITKEIYEYQHAVFSKNNDLIAQAPMSRVQGLNVSVFRVPEDPTPERMSEKIHLQEQLLQKIESQQQQNPDSSSRYSLNLSPVQHILHPQKATLLGLTDLQHRFWYEQKMEMLFRLLDSPVDSDQFQNERRNLLKQAFRRIFDKCFDNDFIKPDKIDDLDTLFKDTLTLTLLIRPGLRTEEDAQSLANNYGFADKLQTEESLRAYLLESSNLHAIVGNYRLSIETEATQDQKNAMKDLDIEVASHIAELRLQLVDQEEENENASYSLVEKIKYYSWSDPRSNSKECRYQKAAETFETEILRTFPEMEDKVSKLKAEYQNNSKLVAQGLAKILQDEINATNQTRGKADRLTFRSSTFDLKSAINPVQDQDAEQSAGNRPRRS